MEAFDIENLTPPFEEDLFLHEGQAICFSGITNEPLIGVTLTNEPYITGTFSAIRSLTHRSLTNYCRN